MQRLVLNALKNTVVTSSGDFGTRVEFDKGLNVLWADNTCGKSTTLNSILYALGLEILLGKKGFEAHKPALRSSLDYEGNSYEVLESFTQLEISNHRGEVVTVRRQIKGEEDDKLIVVNRAGVLTDPSSARDTAEEFFYIHTEGAAQRERGFHFFLARFLGLTLPLVSTFRNTEVPLYLECIFPLLFIEQQRGWSALQATTPTQYRIKNVKKIAIEYVLNLDVSDLKKRRGEIAGAKANLRDEWRGLYRDVQRKAEDIGGILKKLPSQPEATLGEDQQPEIFVPQVDDKWINLRRNLIYRREQLNALKEETMLRMGRRENKVEEKREELEDLESRLLLQETALSRSRQSVHEEQRNLEMLDKRISAAERDIEKNRDVLRLKQYGAYQEGSLKDGECPTCHQPVEDVLLDQANRNSPMSIENNIEFLREQKRAAELLRRSSIRAKEAKRQVVVRNAEAAMRTRQKIKDLKTDLTNDARIPAVSDIREIVTLEEKVRRYEQTLEDVDAAASEFDELATRWHKILIKESELPSSVFSKDDEAKLEGLTKRFRENLSAFGFTSKKPTAIKLSADNYQPVMEEGNFEMSFDASASDHIRLVWAYTLALQQVADLFDTNHLGISFYDEPAQQQVSKSSNERFYEMAGRLNRENNQVVITTSEDLTRLETILSGIPCNFLVFKGKVIAPI
jgi:hypothetical protein